MRYLKALLNKSLKKALRLFCLKVIKMKVTKIMSTDSPRRVQKIILKIDLSGNDWNDDEQKRVVAAGKACPVAKTLGDNVDVELDIIL